MDIDNWECMFRQIWWENRNTPTGAGWPKIGTLSPQQKVYGDLPGGSRCVESDGRCV